jgi:hypothetical protein
MCQASKLQAIEDDKAAERFCSLDVVDCGQTEPVTEWLMKATCYSEEHFGGQTMANGEVIYDGVVAIKRSDTRLDIGDRIWIEDLGRAYDVKDVLPEYQCFRDGQHRGFQTSRDGWDCVPTDAELDIYMPSCVGWTNPYLKAHKL